MILRMLYSDKSDGRKKGLVRSEPEALATGIFESVGTRWLTLPVLTRPPDRVTSDSEIMFDKRFTIH